VECTRHDFLCATFSEVVPAEKNEQWREIADSLTDAVIAVSADLEVLAVNAAAETVLDASQIQRPFFERLLGRNQWLAAMIRRCLASGQSLNYPETGLRTERREAIVRADVSPLTNGQGEPEGAVILLHDLSHHQGVEPGVKTDPEALRLSPAGLAHEVKNPLTGIKGAAELLASMFSADARAQQYCELILHGVNRITSLVEQVLAVSGPHRLKHESINIHRLLHQALKLAGAHPEAPAGVKIEQLFDPSLPEIRGDASALERVFLNLIRNALEAITGHTPDPATTSVQGDPTAGFPDSRPTIGPNRQIRLKTALETQFRMNSHGRRQRFLRVEISDNGKGMTPDELQQLFTPFFTTKANGTGLGLVLSQRIVTLHGGRLWAQIGGIGWESNGAPFPSDPPPAQGMTFCVTLPIGRE
jgi:two-component system nitrogen regulation sensor histidine kinase GlnL